MNPTPICLLIVALLIGSATFAEAPPSGNLGKPPRLESQKQKIQTFSLEAINDPALSAAWDREKKTVWTSPSLSVATPGGFGANWGDIYAGIYFGSRTLSPNPIADGSVFAGFGMGSAEKYLGLEVTYEVTDLDPFLKDSTISAKLHRYLGRGFAVSVGAENGIILGEGIDGVPNYYFSASKAFTLKDSEFSLFSSLLLSVAVGSGRFRSWQDALDDKSTLGFAASAGVRVWAPVGFSAGWSGHGIDLGLSLTPFRSFRVTTNLSYTNVYTNYAGLPKVFSCSFVFSDSIFDDTFPFFSGKNNSR